MELPSNDYKDNSNQHKNNHKLCDETGCPIVNLMESQWKLRQQYDQNFPMEEKLLQNKYQRPKKEINPKQQDYENHSLESE